MLNLPRWQVIGIIAITALAALFALPNLLPSGLLEKLRAWSQGRKAVEALRQVAPSLQVGGDGDTIQLAFSNQDLVRRKKEVIDQSIEILRRRVDEPGTIEPTITREGDDRILLQVPGIKDTTDLKRKINQTAKLTFHLVNEEVAQAGQNIPATLPPTTFLAPTREGI